MATKVFRQTLSSGANDYYFENGGKATEADYNAYMGLPPPKPAATATSPMAGMFADSQQQLAKYSSMSTPTTPVGTWNTAPAPTAPKPAGTTAPQMATKGTWGQQDYVDPWGIQAIGGVWGGANTVYKNTANGKQFNASFLNDKGQQYLANAGYIPLNWDQSYRPQVTATPATSAATYSSFKTQSLPTARSLADLETQLTPLVQSGQLSTTDAHNMMLEYRITRPLESGSFQNYQQSLDQALQSGLIDQTKYSQMQQTGQRLYNVSPTVGGITSKPVSMTGMASTPPANAAQINEMVGMLGSPITPNMPTGPVGAFGLPTNYAPGTGYGDTSGTGFGGYTADGRPIYNTQPQGATNDQLTMAQIAATNVANPNQNTYGTYPKGTVLPATTPQPAVNNPAAPNGTYVGGQSTQTNQPAGSQTGSIQPGSAQPGATNLTPVTPQSGTGPGGTNWAAGTYYTGQKDYPATQQTLTGLLSTYGGSTTNPYLNREDPYAQGNEANRRRNDATSSAARVAMDSAERQMAAQRVQSGMANSGLNAYDKRQIEMQGQGALIKELNNNFITDYDKSAAWNTQNLQLSQQADAQHINQILNLSANDRANFAAGIQQLAGDRANQLAWAQLADQQNWRKALTDASMWSSLANLAVSSLGAVAKIPAVQQMLEQFLGKGNIVDQKTGKQTFDTGLLGRMLQGQPVEPTAGAQLESDLGAPLAGTTGGTLNPGGDQLFGGSAGGGLIPEGAPATLADMAAGQSSTPAAESGGGGENPIASFFSWLLGGAANFLFGGNSSGGGLQMPTNTSGQAPLPGVPNSTLPSVGGFSTMAANGGPLKVPGAPTGESFEQWVTKVAQANNMTPEQFDAAIAHRGLAFV